MRFAGASGNGQAYINAALNASGKLNDALTKAAPRWDTLSAEFDTAKAKEMISGLSAQANVANAGISSIATAKKGAFDAEAIKAQGEAAASATQAQGLGDMIGSIGGSLMGAFKPGGGSAAFGGNAIGVASTAGFNNYPTYNKSLAHTGALNIGGFGF